MKTPQHFVKQVLKKLKIKFDADNLKEFPMVEFTELLEENSECGNMPVLLLDEFEAITKHPELFNDDFIDGLRSLGNSNLLTYYAKINNFELIFDWKVILYLCEHKF